MTSGGIGRAKLPGRFVKILDLFTNAANLLGSCIIVFLICLISFDVLGRNAFESPIPGVPELVSLSIVAIVFLQAPKALLAGRMTRSDGVLNFIAERSPNTAKLLDTVFDLVGVAVIIAILYAHWPIMIKSWVRADFIGAVGNFTAPTFPVKAMLTIGAILLTLQFIARILRRYLD
ncbi:MAG: TRAP transporter small permease subunit [Alphaproteobacteria bacterium]